MSKTLLIIDGNSIMNRQFYGIRPLSTKSGIYTNALYGFVNVLLSQLSSLQPDCCAVAFDLKAPTFRHEMYKAYKAGRHATPEELLMQFPYIKKILSAFGISVLELKGYEADDILGTLSKMGDLSGDTKTYILTGDRDSYQLISDSTSILFASNTETSVFGMEEFKGKYGVLPSQFVDVKALMGDSSDNIPGVRGIGEKTALKLICDSGSLENLYARLDTFGLSAKTVEKLTLDRENAFLSQTLARINCDVPLNLTLEDITLKEQNRSELLSLFTELEFSAFIKRLSLDTPELSENEPECGSQISPSKLNLQRYENPVALCLDSENIQIYDGNESFICPVSELSSLAPFFFANKLIVHDCKSLYHTLSGLEIYDVNIAFDTMLGGYMLSPESGKFELSSLCLSYLSKTSCSARSIYELYKVLDLKIAEQNSQWLYYNVELPLAKILFEMEASGFAVDTGRLADLSKMLDGKINETLERIYSLAGHTFNVSSPKQLGTVLFDELKLPAVKKTKSGYSTDAAVLEKLAPYHEIIPLILDYRQFAKLKSTYADGLLSCVHSDGRVRCLLNQTVTATGRLSSSEPNLQNIPIKTALGREIRSCFVAKEGCLLVDADYSQIELRILAHISGDSEMTEAFINDYDIHTSTASKVFNVAPEDVTPELRKRAKAINFGIVYGMGAYTLASDLHISNKEAADHIAEYKRRFSGVSEYLSAAVEGAYRNGYVSTMLGRRRFIPELSSGKAMLKNFGERVAMNSPIQGSAADIIKIAMVKVQKALKESDIDGKLIMQVHDELILEVKQEDAPRAAQLLKEQMEGALELSLPLKVETGIGKDWTECH